VTLRNSIVCFTLLLGCSAPSPSSDDSPEAQRILDDPRYEWITIETPNTRVHLPVGSFAAMNRGLLPARAEEARSTVLNRLNEPDFPSTLHLFYVDSRADMEQLVGIPVTGFAYFDDQAVVLVFNSTWRSFERHELTHVVTLGTWPDPAGAAAVEGLATYVDGFCGGYENGRVAHTMLDTGTLLPFGNLTGEFRQQDDLVAYLQAAVTTEFAVERLGADGTRKIWEQGLAAVPELLDISSRGDFVLQFEDWLSSTYEPIPLKSWDAILEHGCGIDSRPGQLSPFTGGEFMRSKEHDRRVDYVEFPATDMEVTKRFYSTIFGWEFIDYGPDYMSFNDGRLDGGFRLEPTVAAGGPLVVMYSTRLEGIEAAIRENGGQIVQETFEFPGGRRFHFSDPNGNELAVWSDQ
jgi:predicted enzyme related to lactoylglutathione lyase